MRYLKSLKIAAVTAVLLAPFVGAHAAVPTEAQAVFTTVATDFATILGYAFVLMASVVVGKIVLSMVSSMAKRASS